MPLHERRGAHPIQWVLLLGIATQLLALAFVYGELTARAENNSQRLDRIERKLDTAPMGYFKP